MGNDIRSAENGDIMGDSKSDDDWVNLQWSNLSWTVKRWASQVEQRIDALEKRIEELEKNKEE